MVGCRLVARSFSDQLNDLFLLDDTLDELTNQVEQKYAPYPNYTDLHLQHQKDLTSNGYSRRRYSLTTHNVELTALQARLQLAEELLDLKKRRLSLPAGATEEEIAEAEERAQQEEEELTRRILEAASKPKPALLKEEAPVAAAAPTPAPPASEPTPAEETIAPIVRNPIGSDDEGGEESRTRRRLKRRMQNYSISSTDIYGMMGSNIPPNPVGGQGSPVTTPTGKDFVVVERTPSVLAVGKQ